MSQNLISLVITQAQIDAALAGIAQAEAALEGLISLTVEERKSLMYMGPKSESFVRGTIRVMVENPHISPPSLDVAGAQSDLGSHDMLHPARIRLQRLLDRINDTMDALGSDAMDLALEAYGQLKLSGEAHGLETLRRDLGGRFAKAKRKPKPAE